MTLPDEISGSRSTYRLGETYASLDRGMAVGDEQLNKMRDTGRQRIRSFSPEYGAKCFLDAIDFVRLPFDAKSPFADESLSETKADV